MSAIRPSADDPEVTAEKPILAGMDFALEHFNAKEVYCPSSTSYSTHLPANLLSVFFSPGVAAQPCIATLSSLSLRILFRATFEP